VGKAEREKRRLPDGVSAAEILVDAIPREALAMRFRPFSLFPPIVADLSFSHQAAIAWETLDRFARELGLANLESLRLFDRYSGPGVPEGEVKTTVRLTFRSAERTLEQGEVNSERDRLAAALREEFGVTV
jgi:phenylalanyl-tRNA synthetase beta chain